MESLTLSEDEQWVRDQGVPDMGQPFIQKYLQGRDSLVAQEKKQRSGSLEIKSLCRFLSLFYNPLTISSSRPCLFADSLTHGC